MRRTAFAPALLLLAASASPAPAQQGGNPEPAAPTPIAIKILEMEQAADIDLLQNALRMQGQQAMQAATRMEMPGRTPASPQKLEEFIAARKAILAERAEKIHRAKEEKPPAETPQTPLPPISPEKRNDVRAMLIEVQRLQTEVQVSRMSLNNQLGLLAQAEFNARVDPKGKADADAARAEYEKIKVAYLAVSLQLIDLKAQLEQADPHQQVRTAEASIGGFNGMNMGGMGGMGGGMGGMGGGMGGMGARGAGMR